MAALASDEQANDDEGQHDDRARSADVERKFENLADMRIKLRQRLEEEELNSQLETLEEEIRRLKPKYQLAKKKGQNSKLKKHPSP